MAFAELVDGRLVVQTQWHEKDIVKQIPGAAWDPRAKTWTLPLSWGSCVVMRGVFGDTVRIGPKLNEWAWRERRERIAPANAVRERTELLDDSSLDAELLKTWREESQLFKTARKQLFPFQEAGVQFLVRAGDALLADEMGTGKTVQTLSAIRALKALGRKAFPVLVVCPNSLKTSWENHAADWLPEANVYVVRGGATERKKILAAAKEDPMALVIVNFESMRLLSRLAGYGSIRLQKCRECDPENGDERLTAARCEIHPKVLNQIEFATCVLDEAHRVKDPKAKQTRAIWYTFHHPSVQRRWALTGTPIANHPGELWSTMYTVSREEFPVKSKFLDRFAMMSWNQFGGMDIVGLRPDTRDELFKFFDPRFRRMTKAQVLPQLPPKTRIVYHVEMTPKQRRAYEEMSQGMVTYLDDGTMIVARSNLTARIRLLQLASSYCKISRDPADPDNPALWKVELSEPSPKVDALFELIDDLKVYSPGGTSIVVASDQRKLLELASARLEREKKSHVMITGTVPEHQRAENLARFQAGDVPLLMFTYKAGGVGLNMTKASVLIRLQRSWSLIDNRQGEDRVHRIGSKHDSVTIIDVVTAGTVEEQQMQRLAEKLRRLEEINRDRERLRAAGISTQHLDEEEAILAMADLGEEGEVINE